MLRLFDYLPSGNGYKIRLLLAKLGTPYRLIERDIDQGETRTPEFLAKNPNGRIPLLELEDGTHLAESNAILCYLADGTRYLPADRLARAQVLQWLFFEQYSHEPNIATLRYWRHHPVDMSGWRAHAKAPKFEAGVAALGVMETHLAKRGFFVGERLTIADLALYAYTHVAEEGGFTLEPFPAVRAWLARVAADRPHVKITDRP
jgi:glutathione S-transferase